MYDEDDVYMGEGFFTETKRGKTVRIVAGVACAISLLLLGVLSVIMCLVGE